ncbi:MAG: response regulator [Anaerolineae bacterium]|nr:response regulator [Anaerolineae bacterium]
MNPTPLRALIVEDDRSWQQILSEILVDEGLEVEVAESLSAATALLRERPHRVAVVDLSLGAGEYGNQDGLRVLDAIRRQDPGCAAIMLTGFATVEIAVSALTEHGALTCLRKASFSRAQFRELIGQALARAAPLGAGGAPDSLQAERGAEPASGGAPAGEPAPLGVVLVVEDDASWRALLTEMVEDGGYQVRACGSYGEALGCLRRERYALAVVDLSLSGKDGPVGSGVLAGRQLDGYRLLDSAREAGVPAIVVSGVTEPEAIERAYAEQGVLAYVEKQAFDRRAFMQALRDARAASALGSELVRLTERERKVLELVAQGMTNKEIAAALVITTNTVKRHLKAIFDKLEVHTRAAAAAKAISGGVAVESPPVGAPGEP